MYVTHCNYDDPEWLKAITVQWEKDGVILRKDHRNYHKVIGIIWRSGKADRNKLAEVIMRKVTEEEIPLDMDGQHYLIRRINGGPEERQATERQCGEENPEEGC